MLEGWKEKFGCKLKKKTWWKKGSQLRRKRVTLGNPLRDCGSCAFSNWVTHSLGPKQKSSEEKIPEKKNLSRNSVASHTGRASSLVKGGMRDIKWDHLV